MGGWGNFYFRYTCRLPELHTALCSRDRYRAKEHNLVRRLSAFRALEMDPSARSTHEDIRKYLLRQLTSPNLAERLRSARRTATEVTELLLKKSEGNILFVRDVLQAIELDRQSFDNADPIPLGLYCSYESSFNRQYPNGSGFADARNVLEVLATAREPLTEGQLAAITGLDLDSDLAVTLQQLEVYLIKCATGHATCYRPYHHAFIDWLTGENSRGTAYHISRRTGSERLAGWFWEEYHRSTASLSKYCLAYLPEHLNESMQWERLEELLTNWRYLEAKTEAGFVFGLARDLARAVRSMPPDRPRHRILMLIDQGLRQDIEFVAKHPTTLFQCIWNRGWWYDSPATQGRYIEPSGGWPKGVLPWEQPGEKLYQFLEAWWKEKEEAAPGFVWVRNLRPPTMPVGSLFFDSIVRARSCACAVATWHDLLAVSFVDGTVSIWKCADDWNYFTQIARLSAGPGDLAFSPSGTELVCCTDNSLRIANIANGTIVRCLEAQADKTKCVAYSPDGEILISGGTDGVARVWDSSTGKLLQCLVMQSGTVWTVAFSKNGQVFASGAADGTVCVWKRGSDVPCQRLGGHEGRLISLAFLSDGSTLATLDNGGNVRMWDTADGKILASCLADVGSPMKLSVSPTDELVVGGFEGVILLAEHCGSPRSYETVRRFPIGVLDVDFCGHGTHIVAASDSVGIWAKDARKFSICDSI